jgi:hypothetical protein
MAMRITTVVYRLTGAKLSAVGHARFVALMFALSLLLCRLAFSPIG